MAHAVAGWMLKLTVETVSIGFGPRLLGLRIGATDYRLSLIPFGGYTKYQGAPLEELEKNPDWEVEDSFLRLAPAQKIIIASAGPLSSLLLAFSLLTFSWWIGREEAQAVHERARVGWLRPGSALAQAGLSRDDEILAVDYGGGKVPVTSWRDLLGVLARATGYTLKLDVRRGAQTLHLETPLAQSALLDVCHDIQPRVGSIKPGSPAAASFRPNDLITEVNGRAVYHWLEMEAALFTPPKEGVAPPPAAHVKLERDGQLLAIEIPGDLVAKGAKSFGLQPPAEPARRISRPLGKSLRAAFFDLLEMTGIIERFLLLKGEFTRKLAGDISEDNGYRQMVHGLYTVERSRYFILAAFLSLCLGLMNMIPIPALNGGLVVMAAIEAARGRPLSLATRERLAQIGFILVLILMATFIIRSC